MARRKRGYCWFAELMVMLLVMLSGAACGSNDAKQASICEGVRLERDAAAPMEWVELALAGTDEANVAVRVHADGYDPFPALVAAGDDSGVWVLAPIHPAGLAGGQVELEVVGDEFSCSETRLTIEPIPESPGAFRRLAEQLDRIVELEARHLGTDQQALVDAIDTDWVKPSLPASVLALAKAQFLLAHPANSNSLKRIAAGDAPAVSDEAAGADFRFLDAVVAHSELLDTYEEHIARLEQLPPGNYQWTQPNSGSALSETSQSAGALKKDIRSAAELSAAMVAGDLSCRMVDNDSLKRFNSAVGTITAAPNEVVGAFGVGYSAMMAFIREINRARCGLFPRELVNFQPRVDQLELEEDRPELALDPMTVGARSGEWNVSETVIEALFQVLGWALSDFSPATTKLSPKSEAMFKDVAGQWIEGIGKGEAMKQANSATQWINERYGSGTIGPFTWSGITLDSSDYVGVHADFLQQLEGPLAVAPRQIGQGPVVIEALRAKFPPEGARVTVPGAVNRIEIEMLQRILVNPGETKEIYFEVKNAFNTELQWSNNAQQAGPIGALSGTTKTDAPVGKVLFDTPSDRGRYPVTLTAESLSKTGLSHPDNDPEPLLERVFLYDKDVEISPRYVCLTPGSTHQFTARTAHDDPSIEWSPAAQIDRQDDRAVTYTAPSSKGTYEVRVEATYTTDAGDEVTAEDIATVRVDDCKCWWALDIIGRTSARGEFGVFTSMSDFTYDLMLGADQGGLTRVTMFTHFPVQEEREFAWPGPPDEQGRYYTAVTPGPTLGPFVSAPPDESVGFVESFDGDYVEGSSFGQVIDTSTWARVAYEMQFKIAYAPPDVDEIERLERVDQLCPED